jgi:hypothetical protein
MEKLLDTVRRIGNWLDDNILWICCLTFVGSALLTYFYVTR